jgi:hypothetical protein
MHPIGSLASEIAAYMQLEDYEVSEKKIVLKVVYKRLYPDEILK